MINQKYLPPELRQKLNSLPVELCLYRRTSQFKQDLGYGI